LKEIPIGILGKGKKTNQKKTAMFSLNRTYPTLVQPKFKTASRHHPFFCDFVTVLHLPGSGKTSRSEKRKELSTKVHSKSCSSENKIDTGLTLRFFVPRLVHIMVQKKTMEEDDPFMASLFSSHGSLSRRSLKHLLSLLKSLTMSSARQKRQVLKRRSFLLLMTAALVIKPKAVPLKERKACRRRISAKRRWPKLAKGPARSGKQKSLL